MTAAVATPHRIATGAGVRALERGGTAIDAALAAAAVLTVVYPHNCALGGDLIALVREPDGTATVVNASGPAPAGVDVAALRTAGSMPVTGVHTVTVPGLVAGWGRLHARSGRRPWAEALRDAEGLAREGVAVTERLAQAIAETPGVRHDAGMAAVFAPGGTTPTAGEQLRQPELAATLAVLAEHGAGALYRGPLAEAFSAGLGELGSAITRDDLSAFAPVEEPPLRAELSSCGLLTAGPNSAGVLLPQALLALEAAGPEAPLGADAGLAAAIFATGAALRDRALADGVDVSSWLSPAAVAAVAEQAAGAGVLAAARPSGDTVAVVATDEEGRAVSLIQSLFHGFGAQLLEPRTGVLLHNRGAAFTLDAGHPNVLAPGKRPAHTLMPVMVERDGRLLGVLGTMGGKVQAQIHVQVLLRLLGGAGAQDAVAAPRFAVGPMEADEPATTVRVEEDCDPAVPAALHATGMRPLTVPPGSEWLGHAQAIWLDGAPSAGSDPRADGAAVVLGS